MTCPICARPTAPDYRPFCCKRCADLDLARWLGGTYAVPSQDPEEALEAQEEMGRLEAGQKPRPH